MKLYLFIYLYVLLYVYIKNECTNIYTFCAIYVFKVQWCDIFASLRAVYTQALLLIVRVYLKGHFLIYMSVGGKIFFNKMRNKLYISTNMCIIK